MDQEASDLEFPLRQPTHSLGRRLGGAEEGRGADWFLQIA